MNVADSYHVASSLEQLGYEATKRAEDADVIVLNTCVVRQSAEDKAYGRLNSLKPLKKKRPGMVINVMGCLIGVRGNEGFKERFPYVDVLSPPSNPEPLLRYLLEREGKKVEQSQTEQRFARMDEELILPLNEQGSLVSSFIPIVLGCSHACSYCVIPYRRGVEKSRSPEVILAEAQSLARQGVKEITLLGQIVDRYGKDNPDYPTLANLLRRIHEIEGIERLRFLTSHPNYFSDDLLDAIAELPKVMPHIEVPAQAGDDEVLANMRRGYTGKQYRDLVRHIRDKVSGVSIATDIIVGFPGETQEQFEHTYELLEDLKMDVAHLARYSPRPQTLSSRSMVDDVPDEEKWRRFRALEDLQEGIAAEIHSKYLGEQTEILFEAKQKGRWRGRTPTNKLVFVESDQNLLGKILPIEIVWTGPWSMQGKLV